MAEEQEGRHKIFPLLELIELSKFMSGTELGQEMLESAVDGTINPGDLTSIANAESKTSGGPAIGSIVTDNKPVVNAQTYTNTNGPEYVRKIKGPTSKWQGDKATQNIIDEVLSEDFDIINEETRNFNNKSSIVY
jgi:hypothetical protein